MDPIPDPSTAQKLFLMDCYSKGSLECICRITSGYITRSGNNTKTQEALLTMTEKLSILRARNCLKKYDFFDG